MDFDKYSSSVIKNIDKDNMNRIIEFLKSENCSYIKELLDNYLDLFTFDYDEFVDKYNKLNNKYSNYLELVKDDMNLLEEFYSI